MSLNGVFERARREMERELREMNQARPTLRDQFAMAALPVVASNEFTARIIATEAGAEGGTIDARFIATIAYGIADAMLAAREVKP